MKILKRCIGTRSSAAFAARKAATSFSEPRSAVALDLIGLVEDDKPLQKKHRHGQCKRYSFDSSAFSGM
jgi:hypothetical protein